MGVFGPLCGDILVLGGCNGFPIECTSKDRVLRGCLRRLFRPGRRGTRGPRTKANAKTGKSGTSQLNPCVKVRAGDPGRGAVRARPGTSPGTGPGNVEKLMKWMQPAADRPDRPGRGGVGGVWGVGGGQKNIFREIFMKNIFSRKNHFPAKK